jgi:mono/diheme cytochrome c family protein
MNENFEVLTFDEAKLHAEEKYGEIYAQFGDTAIPELAQNDDAMKIGQRLFANNCSVCHGTAARGQTVAEEFRGR